MAIDLQATTTRQARNRLQQARKAGLTAVVPAVTRTRTPALAPPPAPSTPKSSAPAGSAAVHDLLDANEVADGTYEVRVLGTVVGFVWQAGPVWVAAEGTTVAMACEVGQSLVLDDAIQMIARLTD